MINATEKKALTTMKRHGFTFYGDSIFKTFIQAKRCLDGLERKGLAERVGDEFCATLDGRNEV